VAALSANRIVELPPEKRPAPLQLAQHVPAIGVVLLEELPPTALPVLLRRPAVVAHAGPDERKRLDRPDVGVPFEEFPLPPQELFEATRVERADAAPEDEMLGWRHGRDRVELQEAEPANCVEDPARGAVEQLCANRDPPSLLLRHDLGHGPSQA
jgi:hypothetical protein